MSLQRGICDGLGRRAVRVLALLGMSAGDAAAHKLADEGVEVAIADRNSGVSIHAGPIYAGANFPQLAISTKPEFTKLRFGPDGEQRYGAVSVYQLRGGVWEPLMRSDRW